MASLTERMIGAARLDVATYEEVEADRTATGQALLVVVLSALAAGIGAVGTAGTMGILGSVIGALLGWVIFAGLIWLIGTKLLPEPQTSADIGELLRTLGFASAPGLLRVLGIIPFVGVLVNLAVFVWLLATAVIAVRQALDYQSTGRAVGVCVIAILAYMAVAVGMTVVIGGASAVGGGLTGG